MMESHDNPVSGGIKFLASAAENRLKSHPSSDELVAYHGGHLTEDCALELQGHLTLCRDCSALYLDLAAMVDGAATAKSDEWKDTYRTVQQELEETSATSEPSLRPTRWWAMAFHSTRFAYAMVTLSLVTAGLLGFRVLSLDRIVRDQVAPRFNVAIHDVDPISSIRSEAETAGVTLPAGSEQLLLILNPSEPPSFPEYLGKILDYKGRVVWSATDLQPTEFGNFTLEISRRFLSTGQYRIEIYGLEEESETLLDSYVILIEQGGRTSGGTNGLHHRPRVQDG